MKVAVGKTSWFLQGVAVLAAKGGLTFCAVAIWLSFAAAADARVTLNAPSSTISLVGYKNDGLVTTTNQDPTKDGFKGSGSGAGVQFFGQTFSPIDPKNAGAVSATLSNSVYNYTPPGTTGYLFKGYVNLEYQFMVVPKNPAGVQLADKLPVNIQVKGSANATAASAGNSNPIGAAEYLVDAQYTVNENLIVDPLLNKSQAEVGGNYFQGGAPDNSYQDSFNLPDADIVLRPYTAYTADLTLAISLIYVYGNQENPLPPDNITPTTFTAMIDPSYTIDPAFSNDYEIVIGTDLTSVPEVDPLYLGSACCILGALLRRHLV